MTDGGYTTRVPTQNQLKNNQNPYSIRWRDLVYIDKKEISEHVKAKKAPGEFPIFPVVHNITFASSCIAFVGCCIEGYIIYHLCIIIPLRIVDSDKL